MLKLSQGWNDSIPDRVLDFLPLERVADLGFDSQHHIRSLEHYKEWSLSTEPVVKT